MKTGGSMTERRGWLDRLLTPDSVRAERRFVEQFAAYRWSGSTLTHDAVRDISATGVYIVTEERWQSGTLLCLTLQREGPLEISRERRITTQARVVRSGVDGVGLTFAAVDDPNSSRWESLLEGLVEQTKPDDMLSLVRMAEAVTFLRHICPTGIEELEQLIRGRLSNHKVANAVDIILKAEAQLGFRPAVDKLRASVRLVERILEDGSCTEEGWLRHFWAGLLVTSCTDNRKDDSNLPYIELFSQLTTFPVRILTVVCTRATKVQAESGSLFAAPLYCKIDELMGTTGARGLQIERDLARLAELELIEKGSSSSPTLLPSDKISITPTSLALQLFARCNGHRGSLRDFYAVDSENGIPQGTPAALREHE